MGLEEIYYLVESKRMDFLEFLDKMKEREEEIRKDTKRRLNAEITVNKRTNNAPVP